MVHGFVLGWMKKQPKLTSSLIEHGKGNIRLVAHPRYKWVFMPSIGAVNLDGECNQVFRPFWFSLAAGKAPEPTNKRMPPTPSL